MAASALSPTSLTEVGTWLGRWSELASAERWTDALLMVTAAVAAAGSPEDRHDAVTTRSPEPVLPGTLKWRAKNVPSVAGSTLPNRSRPTNRNTGLHVVAENPDPAIRSPTPGGPEVAPAGVVTTMATAWP